MRLIQGASDKEIVENVLSKPNPHHFISQQSIHRLRRIRAALQLEAIREENEENKYMMEALARQARRRIDAWRESREKRRERISAMADEIIKQEKQVISPQVIFIYIVVILQGLLLFFRDSNINHWFTTVITVLIVVFSVLFVGTIPYRFLRKRRIKRLLSEQLRQREAQLMGSAEEN